jgi:hypothetical protein
MKRLVVKVRNNKEYVNSYLEFLNGVLNLSGSELRVLQELVLVMYELSFEVEQSEIEKYIYSYEFRNTLHERLNETKEMSIQYVNTLFRSLLNRGLVLNTRYGYTVDDRLFPSDELLLKIEWNEEID